MFFHFLRNLVPNFGQYYCELAKSVIKLSAGVNKQGENHEYKIVRH
jgi:hypothetical protein